MANWKGRVEAVVDFIFLGFKITSDSDCGHEIQRCFFLGRKAITTLGNVFKSREITLLTKVHRVKAMVFPVVMYGYESWTIKKVEHWRIDAFELWCWRRFLRVSWTARRSTQSILKEIHPVHPKGDQSWVHWKDWCWSWNSNTVSTWCEELTHWKRPWCWERLKAGGEGDRGWDGWMASLIDGDMSFSKLQEMVMNREAWRAAVGGVAKSQTQMSELKAF